MFDIGFPELMLISVVALVVIGPDKLPETVRTIALWIGRFKRSLSNIRMELENEIGADEIRQQLHNETIMQELSDTKSELENIIQNADSTISDATSSLKTIQEDFSNLSLEDEIDDALEDPTGLKRANTDDEDSAAHTEKLIDSPYDKSEDGSQDSSREAPEQPDAQEADRDNSSPSKLTGSGS